MKLRTVLEAAYKGNLGFIEMAQLYQKATPDQIKKLEKVIAKEDWQAYKKIVKDVLGVTLK